MRILIEFPYRTHWKTKEKFKNDYCLFYPKDINGKEDKFAVILPFAAGQTYHILNFICKIKECFNFVDVWELEKPDKNDNFSKLNFIDFILVPKSITRPYGGHILEHI